MVIPKTCGRMGNFLFQAAATMGYAWRHDLEFTFPNTTNSSKHNPIYLQHLVNPKFKLTPPSIVLEEQSHAYNQLPFEESWREGTIILSGYWQTEKYFKEYRQQIIDAFAYPWFPRPDVVSVHVRRGDYLRLTQKHPPVTVDWIRKAMSQFGSEWHFLFFSDDIEWCKENFGRRADCSFSEGTCEELDLVSMTTCTHHICSASTFSWWGAWLNQNPNKRVLIPKLWFVPGHNGLDTSDIVPPEWEKI